MSRIVMYGASDDLIETEGLTWYDGEVRAGREELNGLADGHPGCTQLLIIDPKSGPQMSIWAIYDGCWSFAPGLVDEDAEWPGDRSILFSRSVKCEYSMQIEIFVPEGYFVALASDLDAVRASLAEAPW